MACALRAWAINRRGKNSVRNLRYLPRTHLVRGLYLAFHRKKMSQKCSHGKTKWVSFCFFSDVHSGSKFEEHCSNISEDIRYSEFHCLSGTIYDIITFPIFA